MKLHDWIVALTIGALFGGAFFLRRPVLRSITLSQPGGDGAYHDTFYIVTHFHFLAIGLGICALGLALYLAVIRRAGGAIAAAGAVAFCVALLGFVMSFVPHRILGRADMPRRYVDYPDAFEHWQSVSATGAALAVAALATMLILAGLAWLRR